MKLYLTPGACSLASHIALREAALPFDVAKVDLRTKKADDGSSFETVNPKGYVPALKLDTGEVLTENVALLQYIGDRNPAAKLLPPSGMERYRVQEWLAFVSSEVHKSFSPLFNPTATQDIKDYAKGNVAKRLEWLNGALGSRKYLTGEQFTVADAYLFVILGWFSRVNIDLGKWPKLQALRQRVSERPAVDQALRAEGLK